ncbi:MAG: phospholipase D-like domain-containing protein [Verrucomicrobia bacterium]|jgi:cardiolipin synthase|nr:phospholipase D-like domain-containing protein [Verrucomicrobiota bacterium]
MIDHLSAIWPVLASALHLLLGGLVTVHAVLHKRDTRAVIGWVGLAWLAPYVGALVYFCFGVNRIKRRAVSLEFRKAWGVRHVITPTDTEIVHQDQVVERHPTLAGLAHLGRQLTNRPLLPGNQVIPLVDGDEAYPAMVEAIDGARQSVSLCTYIFDSGRAGDRFLDALSRARQRGVEVRVLIDHVGSRYSEVNMITQLNRAGVRAAGFLPTRVPRFAPYTNLRNHRKILVVDGRTGFTGGTNIRDGHCMRWKPASPVQCLHFRFEGPVVWHLQEAFAVDWAFAAGETLEGPAWFPAIERQGEVWARGIDDGPDEDFDKLELVMIGALAAAQNTVDIITPYFLPDAGLIHALNSAALRGVRVRIVLPAVNNLPVVHWASRALWRQVLERGCEIHLTPPPFDHTKLFLVDGIWSLLGSTNWDPRSLRLNFEFNVECYDEQLTGRLLPLVEHRVAAAQRVSLSAMDAQPLPVRLRDGLARLASPYL